MRLFGPPRRRSLAAPPLIFPARAVEEHVAPHAPRCSRDEELEYFALVRAPLPPLRARRGLAGLRARPRGRPRLKPLAHAASSPESERSCRAELPNSRSPRRARRFSIPSAARNTSAAAWCEDAPRNCSRAIPPAGLAHVKPSTSASPTVHARMPRPRRRPFRVHYLALFRTRQAASSPRRRARRSARFGGPSPAPAASTKSDRRRAASAPSSAAYARALRRPPAATLHSLRVQHAPAAKGGLRRVGGRMKRLPGSASSGVPDELL